MKKTRGWELQGGRDMYPIIEGLSFEETKKNLEMAGATPEEADALLKLGDEAKEAIIQVIMRYWESDQEWASQILQATLEKLGIRKKEK